MSGVTPIAACNPPGETRNPVTTSSKIRIVPACVVRSRNCRRNEGSDRHLAETGARRLQNHRGDVLVVVEQPVDARDIVRIGQQHVVGTPPTTPVVGVPSK